MFGVLRVQSGIVQRLYQGAPCKSLFLDFTQEPSCRSSSCKLRALTAAFYEEGVGLMFWVVRLQSRTLKM